MNPNDLDPADEQLGNLLEALEASLAGGAPPDADPDLPPEQLRLYQLARESLLQMGQTWPRTPPTNGTDGPTFDWLTGTGQLGKFQLKRELGRGGGGIVFLATDTTTTCREVALKLPRLEALLDPELRQRFLEEARLTIGLDHPNLVPVYEAGEVGAICYLASAYAGETTLADWLERQAKPVPVREAAALVAALARGVDYLHEHRVLHRDIKPSNVLVQHDAAGADLTPRLTDFGLAKLLDVAAPGSTQTGTTTGAVLGTAEYMAPEQADARPELLGAATDVYALGAVLYELLVGQPPLRGRNKQDTLRLVLTEEPMRPRRLRPEVPRDLEAVCLKCLEKEPHRRYATARELAEDLQRHLEGKKTVARPQPQWRRAARWARRRPAVAGMVAVSMVATLVLVGGTVGFMAKLKDERDVADWARGEAEKAEREADKRAQAEAEAKVQAQNAEQRARESYKMSLKAFMDCAMKVAEDERVKTGPLVDLRRAVFEIENSFYEQFVKLRGDDPVFQRDRALGYLRMGYINLELGHQEKAIEPYRQAITTLRPLVDANPENAEYFSELTMAHNNLAQAYGGTGRPKEAVKELQIALALRKARIQKHPTVAEYESDLATTHNNLALIHLGLGQLTEAGQAFRDALGVYKAHAGKHPNVAQREFELAMGLSNLGFLYVNTGRFREAEPEYREAIRVFQKLADQYPDEDRYLSRLALVQNNLGFLYEKIGQLEEAAKLLLESIKVRKILVANHPVVASHQSDLAHSLNNLGTLYRSMGRFEDSELAARECLALFKVLADKHPTVTLFQIGVSRSYNNLGVLYFGQSQMAEAERAYQGALAMHRVLAAKYPSVPEHQIDLARSYNNLGALFRDMGRPGEAEKPLQEALAIRKRLVEKYPTANENQADLAFTYYSLGSVYHVLRRFKEADQVLRDALALFEALVEKNPSFTRYSQELALTQQRKGTLLTDAGQPEAALEWFAKAAARFESILAKQPQHAGARAYLRLTHDHRARALTLLGRYDEALRDRDRSVELTDERSRPVVRMNRAITLARLNQHARAIAEAESLAEATNRTASTLYHAGLVYSLAARASTDDAALSERYATRAVDLLTQARNAGHFKGAAPLEELKKSDDFSALRKRDDCQKLIADLEKK